MTRREESKEKWLVLAMSCLNFLVNGAVCYHVGVLNVAVQSTYGSDVIWTSWLMAVYSSMFALAGPVASVVINVSSCRACVFLSGLLALAGWSLSSLVVDVRWLFLTLTMAGVGQSLSVTGGTVVLPSHFPQQTAIANGIFLACGGLASFLHPPLAQALVDTFGLRGAFLILGGLTSHSCLAALFLRPSQDVQERQRKEQLSSSSYCSNETLRSSRQNNVLSFMKFHAGAYIFAVGFGIYAGGMYLLTSALSALTSCVGKSDISDTPITDHTLILTEASEPLHDAVDFGLESEPNSAPDEKCLK
ncbi:monocarboxylate transporter 3-like [Aplysia californica]|uniref:Monocarboxylate transporter 3-like n=1 Tax=Aplysia californica TaxID=6500 RepID=A0ABM1A1Z9_APLCA|nr:monocarboxylate transporter 3-like [Aplysia californica]